MGFSWHIRLFLMSCTKLRMNTPLHLFVHVVFVGQERIVDTSPLRLDRDAYKKKLNFFNVNNCSSFGNTDHPKLNKETKKMFRRLCRFIFQANFRRFNSFFICRFKNMGMVFVSDACSFIIQHSRYFHVILRLSLLVIFF